MTVIDEPVTNTPPTPNPAPVPAPATPPSPVTNQPSPITTGEFTSTPTDEPTTPPAQTAVGDIITKVDDSTGEVTIIWDPPVGTPEAPEGYVIETRPDEQATWEEAITAGPDDRSATILLPPGSHEIRVVALIPTETSNRIVIGTAFVTVGNRPIIEGDGHITTATQDKGSLTTWIAVCIGLVMIAIFFWVPIAWKRRKKRQEEESRLARQRAAMPYNSHFTR